MHAKEIKALTGAPTLWQGVAILCAQIEQKTHWTRDGQTYRYAGYEHRKDRVHFTATWETPRGVRHCRVAISMKEAIDSKEGNLTQATVLCH